MYRVILIALISLAVWGLAGCGSPKPIKYYAVQIPAVPAPSAHTYPVDLVVARLSGPDLLEASPIVYKTGTNQIGTYTYHRWTEPPTDMVQQKLIRLLRNSGEFQSVTGAESGNGAGRAPGGLVLRGRLHDFAEVDGAAISGLVTMEFELYNRTSNKIVWMHFYSQTEPVQTKAVPAVVEALDRNLDRGLNEIVAELRKYFAANPPGKS
jgi:ABC-type uncharacterized transport system auxiliary subunit